MKKIIAAAVATAFVAPAFAADVTISGDVEFKYSKQKDNGISQGLDGDSDFFITATEELGDGMAVKFKVGWEDVAAGGADADTDSSAAPANRVGDAELYITGAFGSIGLGNVDDAVNTVDEYSHVAEDEGGTAIVAGATDNDHSAILWQLPTLVENLSVAASARIENDTDTTADTEEMHTSYALKYTMGSVAVTYGSLEIDGADYSPTHVGVSYSNGPFFVAAEQVNEMGASTTDATTYGITYDYGMGKLYYEDSSKDAAGTKTDVQIYGASYKLGAVNLYLQNSSHTDKASNKTTAGVEYAF